MTLPFRLGKLLRQSAFLWVNLLLFPLLGWGQVSIAPGGAAATQNFNTIGTGTSATLPTGFKILISGTTTSTVRTVGSYSASGTTSTLTNSVGGTSTSFTAGGTYNYGAGTDNTGTDRAVGALGSSSVSSVTLFEQFQNSSSSTGISALTISYAAEKYRLGTNANGFSLVLSYSTDGTTWTAAGTNFNAVFAGGDASNNSFTTAPGATVSISNQALTLPATVAAGGTFYLAWTYSTTSGSTITNAQGLGVDDISVTATAATVGATTIATSTVSGSPFCVGSSGTSVSVPFAAGSSFGSSYTAYISGDGFTTKTSIGTGTTSPISATIPSSLASGTAYRIRVEGTGVSSPTYTDNGSNLTVVNYQSNPVTSYTATAGNAQAVLAWTNPTSCFTNTVVVASPSSVTAVPSGTFTASTTYGSGTAVGTNQYVVYSGSGTTVTVTGLTNGTTYYFKAYTTNGDGYGSGLERTAAPQTPALTVSPTSLTGFTANSGSASAAQTYTLTGTALTTSVTVTAPTGYQVAQSATSSTTPGTYGTSITVAQADATAGRTIYVRLSTTATGTPSGNVTNVSAGATTQNVAVSGTVANLTTSTATLTGFTTAPGTASASQSYVLTGTNLPSGGSIRVVSSDAAYEVSLDDVTYVAATAASPLVISYTVASPTPTVYVRLAASAAAGTYNSKTLTNSVYDNTGTATGLAVTVTVSGKVAAPTLAASPTALTALGAGLTSATKTVKYYSLTAANLASPLVVTASSGFEVSISRTGTFSSSLTITASDANSATQYIYVRMTGAALGDLSGTITNVSGTVSAPVSVSGTVYDLFETFEATTVSAYGGGTGAFATGSWTFYQGGTGSAGTDKYEDGQSVRIRNNSTTDRGYADYTATQGVGTVSFVAAYFSTDTGAGVSLQYSADGTTYTTVSGSSVTLNSTLTKYSYALNLAGPVHIRIIANGSSSVLRENVDNVGITLPTLKATPTTLTLAAAPGQPATNSYVLTGTGLPAGATVAVSSNNAAVLVSTDGGTTYAQTPAALTVPASGTLSQTVYVQYSPAGPVSGPVSSSLSATISNTTGALSAPVTVTATNTATEYTWTGATSNSWSTATNWTPTRTTTGPGDLLIFNGSTTATATPTLDFSGTQTIGNLRLLNNVNAQFNLTDGTARTLAIGNVLTSADLSIAAGSTLTLTNTNATTSGLALQLGSGATATVAGKLVFDASAAGTGSHTLLGSGANSVEFVSGSTFTAAAGATGNPFGNVAALAGTVVFRNGARYERVGGSTPFGLTAPAAIVSFEPTSTFYFAPVTNDQPSLGGRTYGNLEFALGSYTSTNSETGTLTVAGNLTMTSGTTNINIDGGLVLKGNLLVNGGTLRVSPASAATVQLSGTVAQTIGGSGGTLTLDPTVTLEIANAAGVTLARPLSLPGGLALTSGLLTTNATNILTLATNASVTGGSSTSFVNGPLLRPIGTVSSLTSYLFPVGKGAAYRPLTLNVSAQTGTTYYRAEQFEGPATPATLANPDPSGTNLVRVSTIRTFTLTPFGSVPNSSPVVTQPSNFTGTITLSFGPDDFVNTPSDPQLVVAKRSDNTVAWANFGHSASTGPDNGPGGNPVSGTLTSGTIHTFSDFTLGSTNPANNTNPLPVELTSFAAERTSSGGVALRWATASEHNSQRFVVERSLDGETFGPVATVAAAGTSLVPRSYTATDATAPGAALYYRLHQLDFDGSGNYSAVVAVSGGGPALAAYPNPTTGRLTVPGTAGQPVQLLDALGRVVRSTTPDATEELNLSDLPTGLYLLRVPGQAVQRIQKN